MGETPERDSRVGRAHVGTGQRALSLINTKFLYPKQKHLTAVAQPLSAWV